MAPERERFGSAPAGKPRYETPVLMPLGEMARGAGASCSYGGTPSGKGGGNCGSGATVGGFCAAGGAANGQCAAGGAR